MKRTLGVILALLFAGLLTLIIGSPIKNDMEAKKVANAIKEYALPERTQLLDTVSAAGKLVGNGNGMILHSDTWVLLKPVPEGAGF